MFTAFSSCLGHDRQPFARADDRLVALVYGMTADFRYNKQKSAGVWERAGVYSKQAYKVLESEGAVKVSVMNSL